MAKTRKEINAEWDAKNLKRFTLSMKADIYERIKEEAEKEGKPVNRYIMDIVRDRMEEKEKK